MAPPRRGFLMHKSTTTLRRHLVSIGQAAEYADVHPMTMRRWISAGRIRAYRVGPRLVKVDIADLDAMLRPIPTAGNRDDAA